MAMMAQRGGTHCVQGAVLVIGRLPEVDGALADEVEECVGDTTAWKGLDLPELDTDPFRLHTLWSHPDLDGLQSELGD